MLYPLIEHRFQSRASGRPVRSWTAICHRLRALHALVRKARKEEAAMADAADKDAIVRRIKELESNAARLEKSAVEAKSG